jgi:agmatine deiminase
MGLITLDSLDPSGQKQPTFADPFHAPITGLTLPAEWEPQAAVWFTWPQNLDTWTAVHDGAKKAYRTFIAEALRFTDVCLLASTPDLRQALQNEFDPIARNGGHRIQVLLCPTNDSWIRDYGSLTVRAKDGSLVAMDFRFNSWGGKYPPWDADDAVARFMGHFRNRQVLSLPMVLEGGSIDGNGKGLLLTTKQCLLNVNRNPQYNRDQIETILRQYLGAEYVLWLGEGIEGDDTDGHVDDLARFTDASTVAVAIEHDGKDENYAALKANALELGKHASRHNLKVVEVPMPKKFHMAGLRVPATYMNFLIINGAVLLPVFLDKQDDQAGALIEGLFPGRKIIPFDARHLVFGQGAVHCSSMQEPAA